MYSISKFLLLLGTLLCFGQLLGAIPTVVGRTVIKAPDGTLLAASKLSVSLPDSTTTTPLSTSPEKTWVV
jgi:hypothetical protein